MSSSVARAGLAVALVLSASASVAQTRARPAGVAAYRTGSGEPRQQRAQVGRRYATPPGQDSLIRWNTPNASGNLGGPGTGGANGGGP